MGAEWVTGSEKEVGLRGRCGLTGDKAVLEMGLKVRWELRVRWD